MYYSHFAIIISHCIVLRTHIIENIEDYTFAVSHCSMPRDDDLRQPLLQYSSSTPYHEEAFLSPGVCGPKIRELVL